MILATVHDQCHCLEYLRSVHVPDEVTMHLIIMAALRHDSPTCFQFVMDCGVDCSKWPVACAAARWGSLRCLQLVAEGGWPLNGARSEAIKMHQGACAEYLLACGVE